MDKVQSETILIDKNRLIAEYKKHHKGPPGKALELIKMAPPVNTDITIEDFLIAKSQFCAERFCHECPAVNYCGNIHEEAAHAAEFARLISEWIKHRDNTSIELPSNTTYLNEFYKQFPNAQRNADGTPYSVCRKAVFGENARCQYGESCADCWNKPREI